jgi:hypothetical protein
MGENAKQTSLYNDSCVQLLLSKFLSGELKTLEPVFDAKIGYYYPVVENILCDPTKVASFLNELYANGILERKSYDKVIHCPNCHSLSITFHYCCPFCKSFKIERSSLIEHIKCGYMDVEKNFRTNGSLVCPKCHDALKLVDSDYRKAGVWCNCKDCGKNFDVPVTENFCRNCHTTSTFEDVIIEDAYSYSLKEDIKNNSSLSWFLTTSIQQSLLNQGLKIEEEPFVLGKSGAKHAFSIVAYNKDPQRKIVVDIATGDSVVSDSL